MSKDKQGKNQKKTASVDKIKVLSAYKLDTQRKALEMPTPIPRLKR
ncbi:hypothetical protein [Emticicia sp. C21]|nr:hypothetical protein [Emticicia sp. C21]